MRTLLLLLCFCPIWVLAQTKTDTLTNEKIIKMVRSGLSDALIMKSISTAKNQRFDLSSEGLIELKKNKVSDTIILTLFDKNSITNTVAANNQVRSGGANSLKQTTETINSAGFSNIGNLQPGFYILNPQTQRLSKLSGVKSSMQIGHKFTSLSGAKWFYEFVGNAAQVKITTAQPEFYMVAGKNQSSTMLEPSRFVLINVEAKKGKRIIELNNGLFGTKSYSGPSSFSEKDGMVQPIYTEYSENVYKVTFEKKLPNGNYFFAPAQIIKEESMEFFEFDIKN